MRLYLVLIFSGLSIMCYGQAVLPQTHFKYKNTQKLLRQLAVTFGNNRPEPRLTMPAGAKSRRIAEFTSLPTPELIIDEKLYDICRRFKGDSTAALAVIIGHELTHYYNHHTEWMGFAQMSANRKLASAMQSRVFEMQADRQGLYQAYVAGYNSFNIVTTLYLAIYQDYQLPDPLPGYPPKKDRLALLEEQIDRAKTLAFTFDASNFLLLNKEYAKAEGCLNYIATEIPSQEVLNNLGLCLVWQAVDLMTVSDMPFRYPFELEIRNRLDPVYVRGKDSSLKRELLLKAADAFRKAWELNPGYETCGINLAATLSLLDRNGTALETISELEQVLAKLKQPLSPNARLVRGIILTKLGEYNQAKTDFDQAGNAFEAAYNRVLFNWYSQSFVKNDPTMPDKLKNWVMANEGKKETTKTIAYEGKAGELALPFGAQVKFTESFNLPDPNIVRARSGRANNIHYFLIQCSDKTYQIIQVLPGNTTASMQKGVKNGSKKADLIAKYGQPDRIVSLSGGGSVYSYDLNRLFVVLRNDSITSWIIFTS